MTPRKNVVSLHPWFKIRPGKLAEFKALLPRFIEQTAAETTCLFYDFTLNGDVVYCREAYVGAEGVLAHLANVGTVLDKMQSISTLARLEVHGPAAELAKLQGPLDGLNPRWFIYECGFSR